MIQKTRNKTGDYFYKMSLIWFLCGLPNFWTDALKLPKYFVKFYEFMSNICNVAITMLIPVVFGAFYTQSNLSKKQQMDLYLYSLAQPILWGYKYVVSHYQYEIKSLIRDILEIQEVFNDPQVEEEMIKKANMYTKALTISCLLSLGLNFISALLSVIKSEGTFTIVITAWPLVDDYSYEAHVARILVNILWWIFSSRVMGIFIFVISFTTVTGYQFTNLQTYFYGLNTIFYKDISQDQMESDYEKAFVVGVKLHSDVLRCTKKCHKVCKTVLSGQIIFTILILLILMFQMMRSERTLVNALTTVATGAAVLFSTGFFLWNAGDITIEAGKLDTAIFGSGWQNCRGKSMVRIRSLVTISMSRAQKPLVLKGLGLFELSYQSFLRLVKTTYSVFSVIY